MFERNGIYLYNLDSKQRLDVVLVGLDVGVHRMSAPVRNHTVGTVLVGRNPEDEKDDQRSHGRHDKVARRDKEDGKEKNRTEIGPL